MRPSQNLPFSRVGHQKKRGGEFSLFVVPAVKGDLNFFTQFDKLHGKCFLWLSLLCLVYEVRTCVTEFLMCSRSCLCIVRSSTTLLSKLPIQNRIRNNHLRISWPSLNNVPLTPIILCAMIYGIMVCECTSLHPQNSQVANHIDPNYHFLIWCGKGLSLNVWSLECK